MSQESAAWIRSRARGAVLQQEASAYLYAEVWHWRDMGMWESARAAQGRAQAEAWGGRVWALEARLGRYLTDAEMGEV